MISGRCLCGAVRYETADAPVDIFNCYCPACRRESGAGHATIVSVIDKGFKVTGEMKVVAPPRDGGATPIPRWFCAVCGATLFARPPGAANLVNLRAGTIDGVFDLAIRRSEFASLAQPWDRPPRDVPAP